VKVIKTILMILGLGFLGLIGLGVFLAPPADQKPSPPQTATAKPSEPTPNQRIAALVKENKEYFEANREQVIKELEQSLAAGKYQEVRQTGGRYQDFDESVKRMVMEADVAAQTNIIQKLKTLRELAKAYPDEQGYQTQIAKLEQKQKEQQANAEEQRLINTAMKRWNFSTKKSSLDDTLSVYMAVQANEVFAGTLNKPTRASLHLRCAENTTAFYIDWDVFLSTRNINMTYRIDEQKAVTKRFDVSSDHKALGYFGGGQSIPFIKSMLGHNKLLTQVTPYGANPVTVTFDISGLDKAIGALRRSCGW